MKRFDFWRLSLRNIFASPTRSFLTVLGIAIGIGAILAVLTLGDAGKDQVQSEMARLGIDKVWLTAGEGGALRHGDAQMLSEMLGTTATEQVYAPITARFEEREHISVLVGCTPAYMTMMDSRIVKGNDLYPLDWQAGSRGVLLGESTAEKLVARSGGIISLNGIPFYIRGVVHQQNELSQVDAKNAVFMPIAVFCELLGQNIHEITLSVPTNTKPQSIATMAQDLMLSRRSLNVQAVTMQVQIEAANSVMTIFVDVLKWVAAICILVGGIGVMNILLVSVRERRREIGIMKSLGTTQGQICLLFLLEALIYALVGGGTGVLIGVALIEMAGRSIGLQPIILLSDCITVFLSALAVGLFFGVLPASRAAQLKPVDALRDE